VGLPDRFGDHGSREECLSAVGLDEAGVERQIRAWREAGNCAPGHNRLVS
jgi:deoxyxylulose-5-phosphate synthase